MNGVFFASSFRFDISVAKTSKTLLECSKIGRWILLLYSYVTYYLVTSIVTLHPFIFCLLLWFFLQYQLAIYLVSAIQPKSAQINHKCPICSLHFADRFHHCFVVNRCIAICNVHCFLSFTFYASIATILSFVILIREYFSVQIISYSCLVPLGEVFCRELTWKQSGIVLITRSTLIAAGCAGAMGLHVAKEFYIDKLDRRRQIWKEILQILLPAYSVIRRT